MIDINQKILNIPLCYWIIGIAILLIYNTTRENMVNPIKPQIILYHANWCPHCKNFLPIWNEFKNKVNNNKKCDIVDYDCAETECNVTDVPGYPTIIKQIGDERIEYEGPRTVDGLMNFFNN